MFTSGTELSGQLERRRKSLDAEARARFDRAFRDLQKYLKTPVTLDPLSSQEIAALVGQAPLFPRYVSREVYRESGGHPFLAQALLHYLYANSDDGNPPIAWREALLQMGQDGLVAGFLRELYNQLSRPQRELLHIAAGTASNAQRRAIRQGQLQRGQLPERFTWRPFVPKRLPWGMADTDMLMEDLVSVSSLMGLLFRKATDEEQEEKRPYLIQVGNGPPRYVVSARFVWRAFRKGIPKLRIMRRWWAYSDIKLLRLSITLLFVILLLMLALSWVNVPSQLALILSIVPLIYWLYGYIVERHGRDENAIR